MLARPDLRRVAMAVVLLQLPPLLIIVFSFCHSHTPSSLNRTHETEGKKTLVAHTHMFLGPSAPALAVAVESLVSADGNGRGRSVIVVRDLGGCEFHVSLHSSPSDDGSGNGAGGSTRGGEEVVVIRFRHVAPFAELNVFGNFDYVLSPHGTSTASTCIPPIAPAASSGDGVLGVVGSQAWRDVWMCDANRMSGGDGSPVTAELRIPVGSSPSSDEWRRPVVNAAAELRVLSLLPAFTAVADAYLEALTDEERHEASGLPSAVLRLCTSPGTSGEGIVSPLSPPPPSSLTSLLLTDTLALYSHNGHLCATVCIRLRCADAAVLTGPFLRAMQEARHHQQRQERQRRRPSSSLAGGGSGSLAEAPAFSFTQGPDPPEGHPLSLLRQQHKDTNDSGSPTPFWCVFHLHRRHLSRSTDGRYQLLTRIVGLRADLALHVAATRAAMHSVLRGRVSSHVAALGAGQGGGTAMV